MTGCGIGSNAGPRSPLVSSSQANPGHIGTIDTDNGARCNVRLAHEMRLISRSVPLGDLPCPQLGESTLPARRKLPMRRLISAIKAPVKAKTLPAAALYRHGRRYCPG